MRTPPGTDGMRLDRQLAQAPPFSEGRNEPAPKGVTHQPQNNNNNKKDPSAATGTWERNDESSRRAEGGAEAETFHCLHSLSAWYRAVWLFCKGILLFFKLAPHPAIEAA